MKVTQFAVSSLVAACLSLPRLSIASALVEHEEGNKAKSGGITPATSIGEKRRLRGTMVDPIGEPFQKAPIMTPPSSTRANSDIDHDVAIQRGISSDTMPRTLAMDESEGGFVQVDYCPSQNDVLHAFHSVHGPFDADDWKECATRCEASVHSMIRPSNMIHIPNAYCKYYDYGGDGSCEEGRPFDDVWRQCNEDGPDKCMGVIWNSCERPKSNTSVNGAWKLMTAGQDVGNADNPTADCFSALGHWDVFLRGPEQCQFAYFDDGKCYIYGKKIVNTSPLQVEPSTFQEMNCDTSYHGSGGRYIMRQNTESTTMDENAIGVNSHGSLLNDDFIVQKRDGNSGFEQLGSATVIGYGNDIWRHQDSFYFLNAKVKSAEFDIVVRTENGFIGGPGYSKYAKFALMVRDSLEPGAKSFALVIGFDHWFQTIYRPTHGQAAIAADQYVREKKQNGWLKVVRVGNSFTGYYKENESDEFERVGNPIKIEMPEEVYIGVGASDHWTTTSEDGARVEFSDFQFNPITTFQPSAVPIGVNSHGSLLNDDFIVQKRDGNRGFEQLGSATVIGYGNDIWRHQDSFYFLNAKVEKTKFDIVVRTENGFIGGPGYSKYAKFALIVRDSLEPGAKSFALVIGFDHWFQTIYRPTHGQAAIAADQYVREKKQNGWLKVVRVGNSFTGYYKENESDEFERVGNPIKIEMPEEVYVGVGASDHWTTTSEDGARVEFSDFQFNPWLTFTG